MSTPWYLGPLSPFDLESTGIDTRQARIVTGHVSTVLGRAEGRRQTIGARVLINPGVPIPAEATRVHGVTDEIAQAKGCDPADGVNSIAEAVARSLLAHIPVGGFNLAYDFGLLHWECLRHGVPTVAERLGKAPAAMFGPIIDAHVLDKHVDKWRSGSRKLDDSKGPGTATHYGVPLTKAHDAEADAIASVRVAAKIGELYPEVGGMDLVTLHRSQKVWRQQQMQGPDGLQGHLRRTKNDQTIWCDPCWPYCVDLTHPTG